MGELLNRVGVLAAGGTLVALGHYGVSAEAAPEHLGSEQALGLVAADYSVGSKMSMTPHTYCPPSGNNTFSITLDTGPSQLPPNTVSEMDIYAYNSSAAQGQGPLVAKEPGRTGAADKSGLVEEVITGGGKLVPGQTDTGDKTLTDFRVTYTVNSQQVGVTDFPLSVNLCPPTKPTPTPTPTRTTTHPHPTPTSTPTLTPTPAKTSSQPRTTHPSPKPSLTSSAVSSSTSESAPVITTTDPTPTLTPTPTLAEVASHKQSNEAIPITVGSIAFLMAVGGVTYVVRRRGRRA